MKYGANTLIWAESFGPEHYELLPRLKQQGFDGVEFPVFAPDSFNAREIRRELQENGLSCTICSILPQGKSIISPEAAERQAGIDHLTRAIEKTAEVGATILAGPMYSPVGFFTGKRRTDEEWKRAVESWQQLFPVLEQYDVSVALEPLNRFETHFLNTAGDGAKLVSEIGSTRVGLLFDTFHANIEEKSLAAALKTAAPHLLHVHTCENDRGAPGSGHIGWDEVFDTLDAINYDGWLTIESFGFSLGEVSAAASIWRDLAPTPESIATDGVRFLRENVQRRFTTNAKAAQ